MCFHSVKTNRFTDNMPFDLKNKKEYRYFMPYARPIKCEKQGRNIYFHYAYAESQIQIH